ncbi:hypothetical protein PYCC9005_005987 [Savitreella phatthalungensis]
MLLVDLPEELLLQLPAYLHGLEDFASLSSTCKSLRRALQGTSRHTILDLAATEARIFFRPSPHLLVAAIARELGDWARRNDENEAALVESCQQKGIDGLLDLALTHPARPAGLSMSQIHRLHKIRYSTMYHATDLVDKCVGEQWYEQEGFWDGGVDDAYTISADPPHTLLHLIIYGELFGPDLEAFLKLGGGEKDRIHDTPHRPLNLQTRLEFIKYCLPDFATFQDGSFAPETPGVDPRRQVAATGPYAPPDKGGVPPAELKNTNLALIWVIKSSRWRPLWKRIRQEADNGTSCGDFAELSDDWLHDGGPEQQKNGDLWRQHLWENMMLLQGFRSLEMLSDDAEVRERWHDTILRWRNQIATFADNPNRPVKVGGTLTTQEWPFLLGDLRVCISGYIGGSQ